MSENEIDLSTAEFAEPVESTQDNAVLLLAAAEELGYPAESVRSTMFGLTAPKEVHDKAFGKKKSTSKADKE